MAATAEQIALVRAKSAITVPEYSDAAIAAYIEKYKLIDERGEPPVKYDLSTDPPTQSVNESWLETYDLNSAIADIWDAKAAALAAEYDFASDDQRFQRSQMYTHALKQARIYRSRKAPRSLSHYGLSKTGANARFSPVINLPELEDNP